MNTIQPYKRGNMLYRTGVPRTSRYVWFTNNRRVAELYKKRNSPRVNREIFNFQVPTNTLKFINIRNPEIVQYIINQAKNPNSIKRGIYVNNTGRVVRNSKYNTNKQIANLVKNLKNKFGYNYNGFYNRGNNKLETEVLIFNNKIRNMNRNNKLKRSVSLKNQPTHPMHNRAVSFSRWRQGERINRQANAERRRRNAQNLQRIVAQRMQEQEARARAERERAARARAASNKNRRGQNFRYKPQPKPTVNLNRERKRREALRQLELAKARGQLSNNN